MGSLDDRPLQDVTDEQLISGIQSACVNSVRQEAALLARVLEVLLRIEARLGAAK